MSMRAPSLPRPSVKSPVDLPRNTMDDVDPDAALLVDVLKLATFVGAPLRGGVAEPLGLAPTDLRIILALGAMANWPDTNCPTSWACRR
jgi:hypothetical protein